MEPAKKKILYIEDDAEMASLYRAVLEKAGIEVTVALVPEAGIELARTATPDLLLLDIMLPGLSGYEIMKILKNDPATRNIKIVCFSAMSSPAGIDEAKSLGADDYFVKSMVSVSEVVDRLKNLLNLPATAA